jgi:hypothetical protein
MVSSRRAGDENNARGRWGKLMKGVNRPRGLRSRVYIPWDFFRERGSYPPIGSCIDSPGDGEKGPKTNKTNFGTAFFLLSNSSNTSSQDQATDEKTVLLNSHIMSSSVYSSNLFFFRIS